MNSQRMSGWLLTLAPIFTFLTIGGLYPLLVGDQETPTSSVQEMMANPEVARVLLGIGSISFVSIFGGLSLLARSMWTEGNAGTGYAAVAMVIFVSVAAVAIAATGLSAGALEASSESVPLAVTVEGVSQAMFAGVWFYWGIGSLILGITLVMQKNLHVAIAWGFVVFGLFVVITSLIDLNLADTVGIVVWVVSSLLHVGAGVQILRQ
jgi:hypothetical protein